MDSHHRLALRDMVQLHLVVLAWGFTAILGKLISLSAVEVTIWRTALAAAGLGVITVLCRFRTWPSPRSVAAFLGTGLLIGWHWMLFFLSARLGSASVSLAAMPTVMIWCSLIEPLFDGTRRWSRMELLVGLVMVGAVWLIYRFEFAQWIGFTVGLLSAFLAALFAVINKSFAGKHPPVVICGVQMVGACLGCLLLLPFTGASLVLPVGPDLLWLLVLSQVCTVGAYVGYLEVLQRLSVFTINVVYNLEPVYGIVLAALILGDTERMSLGFYCGAAIIIAVVMGLSWVRRQGNDAGALTALGE
jgi:drug/metabolite transporter (DMT)-like permease